METKIPTGPTESVRSTGTMNTKNFKDLKKILKPTNNLSDIQLLLNYLRAEAKQAEEYLNEGTWHVDCACDDCNYIREWLNLSWWRRLKAKLSL